MTKAIDILIDKEFISKIDKDEIPTTWILRSMTGIEFLEVTAMGRVDHEKILNWCLTGWKKFIGSDGKEIEFSRENINRVPPIILQDISLEIQEMSAVSEKERKNSSSQSKLSTTK